MIRSITKYLSVIVGRTGLYAEQTIQSSLYNNGITVNSDVVRKEPFSLKTQRVGGN